MVNKMKVAFYTLGCKVNTYETEAILEQFQKKNFTVVDFDSYSDIYVINSCMVTNAGEKKSKQIIRRPAKINPEAIVIVMGCLSQIKAEEILNIEGVKIVLGTKNREQIIDYLNQYLENKIPLNMVSPLEKEEEYDSLSLNDFKSHQRAFVKIQDGCNNFCTYCIIPFTRGRIRSKAKSLVLHEIEQLVNHGHQEVVLTGIHTGGYGEDLSDYSFAELLSDMERIEGLKRIRISSIEITEIDEDILKVIAKSKKIVHHLHVPLQGGTDRILRLMNRKYTLKEYEAKIYEIRKFLPDVAFTTDIIVGFPTETDKDFQETYDFINKIGFQELHVFPFSRRKGTVADKMADQVDGNIKKQRVQALLDLSDILLKKYTESKLNSFLDIIVEQSKNDYLVGHAKDYLAVKFKGDMELIGTEVQVKLLNYQKPYNEAVLIK